MATRIDERGTVPPERSTPRRTAPRRPVPASPSESGRGAPAARGEARWY